MNIQSQRTEFLEYVRLLVELRALIREGVDESDRGEAVREAMDKPWNSLTDDEKTSARQLAADLDTLGDRNFAAESDANPTQSLERARDAREWMTLLRLLQESTMQHISPAIRARLRGDAWFALGVPVAACLFYQDALAAMSSTTSPETSAIEPVEQSTPGRPRFPRYRISEAA